MKKQKGANLALNLLSNGVRQSKPCVSHHSQEVLFLSLTPISSGIGKSPRTVTPEGHAISQNTPADPKQPTGDVIRFDLSLAAAVLATIN